MTELTVLSVLNLCVQTDRPTNQQTDMTSYRSARTHLKSTKMNYPIPRLRTYSWNTSLEGAVKGSDVVLSEHSLTENKTAPGMCPCWNPSDPYKMTEKRNWYLYCLLDNSAMITTALIFRDGGIRGTVYWGCHIHIHIRIPNKHSTYIYSFIYSFIHSFTYSFIHLSSIS